MNMHATVCLSAERRSRAVFYLSCAIFALAVVLVVYCRVRLLAVPLERDEGEFAYIAQQLLRGVPVYESANTMKLMGIHVVYALFMALFGETAVGIHTGLMLVNLGNILLVYLIASKTMLREEAPIAATIYALLSLSCTAFGVFAHATHYVSFFALGGICLLLDAMQRVKPRMFYLAGISLGISITMKQNGIFFCAFAFAYLVNNYWRMKCMRGMNIGLLACGMITPYLAIVAYMLVNGQFEKFWFWTVTYTYHYAVSMSPADIRKLPLMNFIMATSTSRAVWILAMASFACRLCRMPTLPGAGFITWFFFVSLLAIVPGLKFYPHYFILLFPATAFLAARGASECGRLAANLSAGKAAVWVPVCLVMAAGISFSYKERSYLFTLQPVQLSDALYTINPFPESLEIARYIKRMSNDDATIAILGSEPQILFYADRQSATRHLSMYALTDGNPYSRPLQNEMISEITVARPEYIVLVNISTSWQIKRKSPRILLNWAAPYLANYYSPVGLVDMSTGSAVYSWNNKDASAVPAGDLQVRIYQRNDTAATTPTEFDTGSAS